MTSTATEITLRWRTTARSWLAISMLAVAALFMAAPMPAAAHAFPLYSNPPVGSQVEQPPKQVRIEFDSKLEPVFSRVEVRNAQGEVISGKSRVEPGNTVLEAPLPPVGAGTYHVYWHAAGRDGHRTQGDYSFTVGR